MWNLCRRKVRSAFRILWMLSPTQLVIELVGRVTITMKSQAFNRLFQLQRNQPLNPSVERRIAKLWKILSTNKNFMDILFLYLMNVAVDCGDGCSLNNGALWRCNEGCCLCVKLEFALRNKNNYLIVCSLIYQQINKTIFLHCKVTFLVFR